MLPLYLEKENLSISINFFLMILDYKAIGRSKIYVYHIFINLYRNKTYIVKNKIVINNRFYIIT